MQLRLRPRIGKLEKRVRLEGHKVIVGIDEVGRGSIFGSVYAAAVVLDPDNIPVGIKDSKRLTPASRQRLSRDIILTAKAIGIGHATAKEVDAVNVLGATKLAMTRALNQIKIPIDFILIDAVEIACPVKSLSPCHGEEQSISIAAASIIAKVARDNLLVCLNNYFPKYGLQHNKGYCTLEHRNALKKCGVSCLHRRTYRPVAEAMNGGKKAKSKRRTGKKAVSKKNLQHMRPPV